jgi:hypothetical protein
LSYCEKNNYPYLEVNDFSRYEPKPYPHFFKYEVIYEALQDTDWLLYIDFDALFTNFEKRIEDFISDDGELLISKDCDGGRCSFDTGHNNGVMLIKNTPTIKKLFNTLKSKFIADEFAELHRRGATHFFDQSALTYMITKFDEFKNITKEIPAKSFNSYIDERALVGNAWREGDFILHLAGMSNGERLNHINRLLKR